MPWRFSRLLDIKMTECETSPAKCNKCALGTLEQAKAQPCYRGQRCDKLRYYHLNKVRLNRERKRKRDIASGKVVPTLEVPLPEKPVVIRHYYRVNKDSPTHALGAELWVGQRKVAVVGPVHAMGWTYFQDVAPFWQSVLEVFSAQLGGVTLKGFEVNRNIHPSQCPIRPCPLCEGH